MKNWNRLLRLFIVAMLSIALTSIAAKEMSGFFESSPEAWAFKARRSADEISFSEMKKEILASDSADRAMIFTDMVVFEDVPASEEEEVKLLRADLNRNAYAFFSADISGAAASVSFSPKPGSSSFGFVFDLLFLLLFVALIVRATGIGRQGKGPYGLIKGKDLTQSLDDVAGLDLARDEIREIIQLIKSGGKIGAIGARPPKGILLDGPPGVGKTLLARAMAKEAGVSFLSINASRLHDMYIGVGPRRVERAFKAARKAAPCIIFIDEVDAVGARGEAGGKSNQEHDNLINTFLTQMDGLTPNDDLFIIAATNRPGKLDKAFVRPGRLDRKLTIGLPDKKARGEIIALHAAKLPVGPDVDFERLAASTPGMSGADLAALCNEAGIAAGRADAKTVDAEHFASAREKMMMGGNGSIAALSLEERAITGWHEAGHAVVATVLKHADPVEHATILPRGGSLGHVLQVPEDDRHMMSRAHLMDRMAVLAAGRAAEAQTFGADMVTNGAVSDIEALTEIATAMVTRWGMGDAGFIKITPLPGADYPAKVTGEIRALSEGAMTRAEDVLREHTAAFTEVANALIERDTLSGAEIRAIVEKCRQDQVETDLEAIPAQ